MKRAVGVSMKHVAKAARVSVMTVSLAMRHDIRIPAATQQRILKVAQRIGYRKNPLVAALMANLRGRHPRGQDAHVIAYLESTFAAAAPQTLATLQRFRRGARESAEVNGYRLELFTLGEGGVPEARLLQILAARGIRGAVFAPFPKWGVSLTETWDGLALATIGYSLRQPQLHRAINHHAHSVRLTVLKLMALGYRKIGLVLNRNENERTERAWLSSFLQLRHEYSGKKWSFPLLLPEADKVEERRLLDWLARTRPDCVVSPDGWLYPVIRGIRLPSRKAMGFASLHLNASCAGCSGIDQNNERVGGAAIELVIEQLHGNSYGVPKDPKTVLIEGCWVAGASAPAVASVVTVDV